MVINNIIALFIPCYNEESRLNYTKIAYYISVNSDLIDFYFIDDGSTDNTNELILNDLVKPFSNSKLISLPKNVGKGNALRFGILSQARNNYEYFGFIDADLEIPFEQVINLYSSLKKTNFLVAISYIDFNNNLKIRNYLSKIILKISNSLIQYSKPLKDSQCGCKLFRRETIIAFEDEFISRWLFDIEIFIRLKKSICDFEGKLVEENVCGLGQSNSSKVKVLDFPVIMKDIFMIYKNKTG